MSARCCLLPGGVCATRPEAFRRLKAGEINYFRCPPSGQISTVARAIGMSYTSSTLPGGLIEVCAGTQTRQQPTGLDSPTAALVGVLSLRERAELLRLLRKLVATLELPPNA